MTESRGRNPYVTDSYAQVAAAFGDFAAPAGERGGSPVLRRPRHAAGAGRPYAADYHVESSFSARQRAYIGVTIAGLDMLAKGKTLIPTDRQYGSLKDTIVQYFLGRTPSEATFGEAVQDATVDMYGNFMALRPNLLPALGAINKLGLAEGLHIIFSQTRDALSDRIAYGQTHGQPELLAHDARQATFTGVHSNEAGGMQQYEVWCPAAVLAKTMVRQSIAAADLLAVNPAVVRAYDTQANAEWSPPIPLEEQIGDQIDFAVQAARRSATVSAAAT